MKETRSAWCRRGSPAPGHANLPGARAEASFSNSLQQPKTSFLGNLP
eukprot:CAMPEP_0197581184 /NCGR_PEP_ID=MMETSP1326-20131121/4774_1 /TAXON_ID=1155430 /ORGANISM="Genus nov. species nov., Strain RCC2288" /LENGTH=46 /DNA_ID= /DNA_START= /DNA_END= /DNA_ORIENTATION=